VAGLDALLYLATRRWALTGAIYALMALAFVVVSSGISLSRIEKRAVAAARAGPGHASGPFPRGTDGSNPVPSSKESATNCFRRWPTMEPGWRLETGAGGRRRGLKPRQPSHPALRSPSTKWAWSIYCGFSRALMCLIPRSGASRRGGCRPIHHTQFPEGLQRCGKLEIVLTDPSQLSQRSLWLKG
jgi:hypothetical protein